MFNWIQRYFSLDLFIQVNYTPVKILKSAIMPCVPGKRAKTADRILKAQGMGHSLHY